MINFTLTNLSDEQPRTTKNADFAESLDRILHSVTNNQQVVFGRLELLLERNDIDDQTKDELKQVFRAVEENNNLITEVKKKVTELRKS
jgi:flagellar hook-basal body complex protein FliE